MDITNILYSVNEYDCDGDIMDTGIFIHFENTKIKVAENIEQFRAVANRINRVAEEISENYNDPLITDIEYIQLQEENELLKQELERAANILRTMILVDRIQPVTKSVLQEVIDDIDKMAAKW